MAGLPRLLRRFAPVSGTPDLLPHLLHVGCGRMVKVGNLVWPGVLGGDSRLLSRPSGSQGRAQSIEMLALLSGFGLLRTVLGVRPVLVRFIELCSADHLTWALGRPPFRM